MLDCCHQDRPNDPFRCQETTHATHHEDSTIFFFLDVLVLGGPAKCTRRPWILCPVCINRTESYVNFNAFLAVPTCLGVPSLCAYDTFQFDGPLGRVEGGSKFHRQGSIDVLLVKISHHTYDSMAYLPQSLENLAQGTRGALDHFCGL